jgi:hypothetical protein
MSALRIRGRRRQGTTARSMTFAGIIGCTLSVILIATSAAGEGIGAAVIVVNNVTGTLRSEASGTTLRAGIDVAQDETIKSGAQSATRVLFQDNTEHEMGENSEVTLDRFVFDPDPAKSKVALALAGGVMRFATGKLPKEDYEFHTPNASLSVRGTVFNLDVSLGGGTSVYVENGAVFFTAGGTTVEVFAGQSSTAPPGGTPSTPAKGSGSRAIDKMHRALHQALLSPDAAKALLLAILDEFPDGGQALIDAIAYSVEQDPQLAAMVVEVALTANPVQQQALGGGLASAATFFANSSSPDATEAQKEIQAAMAGAPGLTQTAFANAGGPTGLVTTILDLGSNISTSNCVSPSRSGNRC